MNDTCKSRLGDEVTMTVCAKGYSLHCFKWLHNDKLLNSTYSRCSSSITVNITEASDFGDYIVGMEQWITNSLLTFHVLADGPPEPVTNLSVTLLNFSATSVLLSFLTGYNYNSTQTFIIITYIEGQRTELSLCLDKTSGRGRENFTCFVDNLSEGTLYNITVISNNSRGKSRPSNVTFTTYKKPMLDTTKPMNDTFEQRLQNNVTISVHAEGYPPPTYEWWHNGGLLQSSDSNYTSTVTFKIGNCKAFGQYILNMTNSVGSFSHVFEILPGGPPAAVRQFQVTNITQSSASLFFISGYDYNDTQSFVVRNFSNGKSADLKSVTRRTHDDGETPIVIHLDGLEPYARYNITVVANNSRGYSEPADAFVYFRTLGGKPDSPNWCIIALETAAGFVVCVIVVVGIVIVCLKCRTSRPGMSAPLLEEDEMSSDEDTDDGSLSGRGASAQATNGAVPGSRLNQTQNDETKFKSA